MISAVLRILALLALLVTTSAAPAIAQEATGSNASQTSAAAAAAEQVDPVEAARKKIGNIAASLDALSADLNKNAQNDDALVDMKLKAETASKDLLSVSVSLRPRLNEIKDRLTALGPVPTDGKAEDPTVTAERKKLTAERVTINNVTGQAENLSIRATKLSNQITEIRRSLFTRTLLKRTTIDGSLFSDAHDAFLIEARNFNISFVSWIKFVWNYKRTPLMSAIFLSALLALLMEILARRLFEPLVYRDQNVEDPPYFSRLSVAFWSTLLPSVEIAVFEIVSYFLLNNFNVLRIDLAPILIVFLQFVVALFFIYKLTRAVLAPAVPNWRLVNVSDRGARLLTAAILSLGFVTSFDFFLSGVSEALGSPVVLTVVKSFVSSMIAGSILLAMAFIKPMRSGDGEPDRHWPSGFRTLLVLAGAGLMIAAALGYVGLARFAATQIVLTGALLVTMYIGVSSGRAVLSPGAFGQTLVGRYLGRRFELEELKLDQAGLMAGLGIYFLVLAIGIPLILLQWGFHIQEIELWVVQLFTEINIGNFHLSLFSVLSGVGLFLLALYGTRWLQRWMDGNVLARSTLDAGVRNSLRTGFGYAGVAIAVLIGISAAGIDLSSLALVAGALSLGIGFGLQNVVSNFVSGLILLVERPFKVGDWVITGTTEGFVRRISVRATEIETFQHQSIIVPNSELINASVGNWTHKNRLGRIEVAVGVSYSSDPRRVMEIMLEIAHAHMKVLKNPEPAVVFVGFGDSSLDFELRVHLADVIDGLVVRTDLRLEIFERFRDEGIEIPFPQRDLNIKLAEAEDVVARLREKAPQSGERGPFKGNPEVIPDNMGGLRSAGHQPGSLHHEDDADGDGDGGDGR